MRSDTQSVTIEAEPREVLAFAGDGANLPRWAIDFARAARFEHDRWIVTTGQGEVPTTIAVNDTAGTVDFRMAPTPGGEAVAYARVLPNGAGSEFVFTQFQQPGTPDEVFEQLVNAVGHELMALKALLEVGCPL